jgi:hypothetical protein
MSIQAQTHPVFKPAMRIITDITSGNPAAVTTSFNHGYSSGIIVRLVVPLGFGMQEVNDQFGEITVISPNSFDIDIDTSYFNPFFVPAGNKQYAQCIPFGEDNSTVYLAYQNVLPY